MKIVHELSSAGLSRPTVLTWGVYDGLHRGHRRIIHQVVERAKAQQLTSTMLTFNPHPRSVLRPETAPPLLQTFQQRLDGLAELGIEQTLVVPFTREFASTSAEQFLRGIVFGLLDAREVYLGQGVAFGHGRQGHIDLVIRIAQELGRFAAQIDEVKLHGHRVRSTIVRRLLKAGYVNLARKMLDRPFEVEGTVVKGRGVGQELLFPTANLQVENAVIPARGVYITLARVEGHLWPSATNVGTRPTFDREQDVSVECHLLDFQQDLLGQRLRLQFLHRLRDEMRFSSVSGLRQQIEFDLQRCRRYFRCPRTQAALGIE